MDLGCGRGRSSVYLNRQGYDVTGVEIDLPTLHHAQQLNRENDGSCAFVRADGRSLCFREERFDYVISFGSTLSEKYRLWMERKDRLEVISEAVRVTRSRGVVVVNFVHRFWNFRHFLSFMRYYVDWARERLFRKRTELGDYTEVIGSVPVRFHAFTIREALRLFPKKGVRLTVWKRHKGLFSDWFFVTARKT